MIKTFAFLSLLFHVTFQQLDVAVMENNLQSATNLIIAKEKKVSSTILSCRANAAVTSSNFKAINASKVFTNSFDAMANLTVKLQTVKEFEGFTKCDNLTTCECITFRMTLCDAQIKEIDGVIQSIYLNASLFYQTLNDITWSYMLDYKPIQFKWTREVAVLKTFNQSKLVMNELSDFNRVIFEIRKYFVNAMDYFESQSLNCSAGNSTFFEEGNLIEDKLRECEDKLITLTEIALEKVNISLNTVATSANKVKASITIKSALGSLKRQLEKQKTCKDYRGPKVSWPRIPDATGKATGFMKVRTCKAKKESYSFTKNTAAANQTKIKNNLDDFKNTANTSSSIQKRSIILTSSSQDIEVITATGNVISQLDVYIQQLNLSIAKVDNMSRYFEQEMIIPETPTCQSLHYPRNSNNAIYKKLCYITTALSVTDALTTCRSKKAELFGVSSTDDYNALFTIFESLVTSLNINSLNLNGIYNATLSQWLIQYQNTTLPLFQYAVPSSNAKICNKFGTTNSGPQFVSVDCTNVATYFCDYGWFNVVPPVVKSPNKTICNKFADIKTSSGLYIKTICHVAQNTPFANARQICLDNGMEFYGITSFDEYQGLLTFFANIFGTSGTLYVNGEYDALYNKFFVRYSSKSVEVYPGAIPNNPGLTCLAISAGKMTTLACSASANFFCEYGSTAAKSPICAGKFDIKDGSGNNLKRACVVSLNLVYSVALNYCKSNGMRGLYAIRNLAEFDGIKNTLKTFLTQIFGSSDYTDIRIEGLNVNGTWYNNIPDPTPLYSGAIPATGSGNNLQLYGVSSTFVTKASADNIATWFVCEYDVTCRAPSIIPTITNTAMTSFPCGTFRPYNITGARLYPELYGVPSGINNRDNTMQYIGYAHSGTGTCGNVPTYPGYISTKNGSAGAYMPCQDDGSHLYSTTNVTYLAYSPKLAWFDVTMSTLDTIDNRVSIWPSTGGYFQYGRACVNGQVQVGRIHAGAYALFINTAQGTTKLEGTTPFQVLACKP